MNGARIRRWTWAMLLTASAVSTILAGLALSEPPKRTLGDRYALLIAVRDYDKNELKNLRFSEADVVELAQILKNAGYSRVVLLTQTEGANKSRFLPLAVNIRKELKGLLEDRSSDDSVIVAFAGHGVQFKGSDESYFCPMDAKLGDKKTLVALSEVYRELDHCRANFKLLLVDACRNDPQSSEARARAEVELESVTRPQVVLPPGGLAAFYSCSAGQKAFENGDLKHGVFFHFVIEGLKGKADLDKDNQVDLDELVHYTKKRVPDFVKDEYGGDVRQVPELVGKTQGSVPLMSLERAKEKELPTAPSPTLANKKPPSPFIPQVTKEKADVFYVPTPQAVVEKMLELAAVKKGDVVYDLGCGDGRIVVTAAKKYGAYGFGFDIDSERVKESLENVKTNGVEDLVTIKKADIFGLELSQANVVTLYLLPDLNVKLIPQLEKLKPGSRIVSHDFDMRGIKPNRVVNMNVTSEAGEEREHTIYLWVTPLEKE